MNTKYNMSIFLNVAGVYMSKGITYICFMIVFSVSVNNVFDIAEINLSFSRKIVSLFERYEFMRLHSASHAAASFSKVSRIVKTSCFVWATLL